MAVTDTETIPRYIAEMGERLARLEQVAEDTRRALERLDTSVAGLRADMGSLRSELRLEWRSDMSSFRSDMAAEFRDIRNAGRAQFLWSLGIMLTGFSGLLGLMARGFHWLP